MEKILIELILTNQCNKKCNYCDLEFKNKSLSTQNLDRLTSFLEKNKAYYSTNFFGGEPLLEFNKIEYFINKSSSYISKYSIGTNGKLLTREILDFFKKNLVKVYLSIDNILGGKDIDLELVKEYKDIVSINFINDPDFLQNSIEIYNHIKSFGFKEISVMPVFSTKKWDKKSLLKLKGLYNYISDNFNGTYVKFYKYFNGVSIDKQFILDTDMYFYSDLDSLLWLQKQYKNIDNDLKNKINDKTKLLSLEKNNFKLKELLNLYNIDNILKLVFEVPKSTGDLLSYKIIDNIFKNENKRDEKIGM